MTEQNFNIIAERYSDSSIVQSSAADILLALLNIQRGESILDIGCGTGNLTKKLFDLSQNTVMGIDPSEGMISESKKNYGKDISFQRCSAEEMVFDNEFDVIFSNSSFQWFKDTDRALSNINRSLKHGGRIGIQAPATIEYCPNFICAIESVKEHPVLKTTFSEFNNPWLFLEEAEEYSALFRNRGFEVLFSKLQTIATPYPPDEVFRIFASGAIAGYLNGDYYKRGISDEYINEFQKIIREDFHRQADDNGYVKLVFNRIFLVAVKAD